MIAMSMVIDDFIVNIHKDGCLVSPDRFTVEAYYPSKIEEEIKILAMILPPSRITYSRAWNSVTIKFPERLIGIYSNGKITFCASSISEVKSILNFLKNLFKNIKEKYSNLTPSEEDLKLKSKLSALKLYNYLPKINCKKCGEITCMAFAVKVLNGEKKLIDCPLINNHKYEHLLKRFKRDFGETILGILVNPYTLNLSIVE
ncbi:MAG: hypothetical protein NDF54_07110 [archaeon GB-1867-035]|nr:hypothetical protein [Candidatus Culexmicrobium profundum]